MHSVLHKAGSRGLADHGWLTSYHSFSFAQYYNPERMHFGALRVLNDDLVAPGRGFGKHPHDNMEIISIPLSGDLRHEDSMGNTTIIREGDVQAMSAGTGVAHSEKNDSTIAPVEFLQIWVFPKQRNIAPAYSQITLTPEDTSGQLSQIVSPSADEAGVTINQDAWFHLGNLSAGTTQDYHLRKAGNGVYAFLLEGDATVAGQELNKRDGLGLWETDSVSIAATTDVRILLMEVPMEIPR
ncbi:pirin family protein [Neolewinella aurantiaca]|uniref:Pirin family protein n=1 Tax=Neolewinella aurantiaca TaxID=2602767 RepID=A0A5C7FW09_9BACT|nr:pirin family protein [Neolewinella aurantiaca]TXF89030.1 pirin family protein [Neolewinella aurantiaca]